LEINVTSKLDLNGKNILITGGTGSFGQKFVAFVLKNYQPNRLVIFSRDELKQYEMAQKFSLENYPSLRYFIGDIRDKDRLNMAMRDIDYVIHAAAMKQVMAAEYNPFECIATNVVGAENVVSAALTFNVKRVVALSTDKAVNPINLYGASKLAADKIFGAANNLSGKSGTRFCSVRYGNVIGSRGSVIPVFRKLIDEGAEFLPITDPRMSRFWITLERSVEFVLSCLNSMHGGEIFIPKISSMNIADLARIMAPHLEQRVSGIRPGEKLHEIMISEDDSRHTLDQGDQYVIEPEFCFWDRKPQIGKSVPEGYRYESSSNDKWLTDNDIQKVLNNS
jgi:UDP-N-acetylglucosamine 4,6-dehydratase/5-epimerase